MYLSILVYWNSIGIRMYGIFDTNMLNRYTVLIYSRTSLVGTPGDRQNVFALSGIHINQYHEKALKGTEIVFVLTRFYCLYRSTPYTISRVIFTINSSLQILA